MTLRKSYITLVELLIVLSLIALVAGAVGWNIAGMQRQEKFYAAVGQVVDKLHAAQELMLIYNDDVTVEIQKQRDGSYLIGLKTGSPMTTRLGNLITAATAVEGLGSVAFSTENRLLETDRLELKYAAVGHRTPEGTLILSAYPTITAEGPLRTMIYLTGYPLPITPNKNPVDVQETLTESEELYPQEVRDVWQRRIEEKEKEQAEKAVPSP